MKLIIYPTETGISVIIPAPDSGLTLTQTAIKDTPNGVPFLIIDSSDIPDRASRNLWTADFSKPDGFGG